MRVLGKVTAGAVLNRGAGAQVPLCYSRRVLGKVTAGAVLNRGAGAKWPARRKASVTGLSSGTVKPPKSPSCPMPPKPPIPDIPLLSPLRSMETYLVGQSAPQAVLSDHRDLALNGDS